MQKMQAEGYGDMVIQRLRGLRRNVELCDFKVSADGRVFEVPSFLPVSQFSASSLCITFSFLLDFSFVWKIHFIIIGILKSYQRLTEEHEEY